MELNILLCGVVILMCILSGRFTDKYGVPSILLFILIGMLFGVEGILKISFSDFALSEKICTTALIFIMFYGGFGTSWKMAKPILPKAVLLSTAGVVLTAGHRFVGRKISELKLWDLLVVMIKREGKALLPRGNVTLREGDVLVLSGESYQEDTAAYLDERLIEEGHPWIGKSLAELSDTLKSLIVMIQRSDGELAVPKGDTRIEVGDLLVFTKPGLKESTQSVQVGKIDE